MKNLLIINSKLSAIITNLKKNNDCEILIIKKNLKEVLKKKTEKFSKVILITEKILPRNAEVYKTISNFINSKKSSFIEISHKKSLVPKNKASSNALINGSGKETLLILEKIIEMQNV
jgi:hypothetical protein